MSISQLLQPNSYSLYGKFIPKENDILNNEGYLFFFTPPTTQDPVYNIRRSYYTVIGSCVLFQIQIQITTVGDGNGFMFWQLPQEFPQSDIQPLTQIIELNIFGLSDKDKYLDIFGEMVADKVIRLSGRLNSTGIVENMIRNDLLDNAVINIRGHYFI